MEIEVTLTDQWCLIKKDDIVQENMSRGDDENDDVWFGRSLVAIIKNIVA